jgi:hypothetical protein
LIEEVSMPSPFPGMDPYIEACGLWGDFQEKLIGPGTAGWQQYENKRHVFLQGHANLVEIDLLRGGRRRRMRARWPDSPDYILAMKKEDAPACRVWPVFIPDPLPEIHVPLAFPDGDLPLAPQPLIDAIYARSRDDVDIDYRRPLEPPLSPEEARFLAATSGRPEGASHA